MSQLAFAFTIEDQAEPFDFDAPVSWSEGVPDRTGIAQYTVALRSRHDDERLTRTQARAIGGGFEAWRGDMKGSAREWCALFLRLFRDGRARTFNQAVLEVTQHKYTADVALGKAPEWGLWLAVERRRLVWAFVDDATRFAPLPPHARHLSPYVRNVRDFTD